MHAPTNGFFYVLDRETGKVISADKTTLATWAKGIDIVTGRPIEEPDIRFEEDVTEIWPGSLGGHSWQAMSFNPKLGLVYIPVQHIGSRFTRTVDEGSDTGIIRGGLLIEPVSRKPGDGKGYLVAWDPVAKKRAWRIQYNTLWNGGTLTTAGGLVFQGTGDGWFSAYNGKTGERLWRFNAGLGIVAAPMTYSVGDKQYVSVLVGYGADRAAFSNYLDAGWKYGAQPRRLLTFAIGGAAKLPESPAPDMTIHALDDPELVIDAADVMAGRVIAQRCVVCHGVGLHSAGSPGPDLRESEIALKLDTFAELLKSDTLLARGMPRFDTLSDDEIRQLHAYIRTRAREAIRDRKAAEAVPPMPQS